MSFWHKAYTKIVPSTTLLKKKISFDFGWARELCPLSNIIVQNMTYHGQVNSGECSGTHLD